MKEENRKLIKNLYKETPSKIGNITSNQTPEYKKYRRKWEENPKYHVVGDFPIHIDFELTTYCNLNCHKKICTIKCPYDLPDKNRLPEVYFDFNLFKLIINEGIKKGLSSIKLNYRGEPLLHPRIIDFIKYAKLKGVLDVMLNTNSSLLSTEMSSSLLNSGLDKLFCSIGPIPKISLNFARNSLVSSEIFENIQNLMLVKAKRQIMKPVVTVQGINVENTDDELNSFIKKWEYVVDKIAIDKISKFILDNDYKPEDYKFTCQYLWQRLFILYNGDVVMCPGNNKKKDVLGNSKKHNIELIWKGEKLNRIRNLHLKNKSGKSGICRRCGFRKILIHNTINKTRDVIK